jgi:hypothetical protein
MIDQKKEEIWKIFFKKCLLNPLLKIFGKLKALLPVLQAVEEKLNNLSINLRSIHIFSISSYPYAQPKLPYRY